MERGPVDNRATDAGTGDITDAGTGDITAGATGDITDGGTGDITDGGTGVTTDADTTDREFGLPPAPTIMPENAVDWPALAQPAMAGSNDLIVQGQLEFIARQNQAIMGMVQNLYAVLSKSQSRRSSVSSTTAGSEAADSIDLTIDTEAGQRVTEAFNALKSEALLPTITQFHDVFVQLHSKKLYVMRNLRCNQNAQEFADYVVKTITDKQAEPQGQDDAELVERQELILAYLNAITSDLKTDLYIMLNKEKKQKGKGVNPKAKGKTKSKGKGRAKGKAKATRQEDDEGEDEEDEDEQGDPGNQLTAAGGPASSRQQSEALSHGSASRRSARIASHSRGISTSSAVPPSQHSEHSATTAQRRRSKQKTRFADEIEDSDFE